LALSIDARSGKPLPGLVQVAMQQGTHAAKDIVRKVRGKPPLPPFRYFDKGTMAVIGRWRAVADIFGVAVSGLPPCITWAFIHFLYLAQCAMRALVFVQWFIQALTFGRGARLITGGTPSDFFQGDGGASGARVPDTGPPQGAVVASPAAPRAEAR